MIDRDACHHCEGKGYLEIRDCGGEIQRTETCSFCEGTGSQDLETEQTSLKNQIQSLNGYE